MEEGAGEGKRVIGCLVRCVCPFALEEASPASLTRLASLSPSWQEWIDASHC